MNYRKDFEKCFDYIEINLKNDISTKSLADYLGYSLFHFCRVFHLYKDMTPMEYILRRRLQSAILDIKSGKKIIDIAMEYQFETASGFSKAFKKYFQKTPSQFKETFDFSSVHDSSSVHESSKGQIEKPIRIDIKEINSFKVCGLSTDIDYDSTEFSWQIAAFWDKYDEKNIEERLYSEINPIKHGEIGVCMKQEDSKTRVSYLLGVITEQGDKILNWRCCNISGGKYAVFTTPPVNMQEDDKRLAATVRNVWRYIFDEWFTANEYTYDEARLDFEFYDERCHYLRDSVMEIYIPII